MIDEVQVVPWCNGHCVTASLLELDIGLVQRLMDVHKPIDNGLTMAGRHRQFREDHRNMIRRNVLRERERERETDRERQRQRERQRDRETNQRC